MIVVCFYCNIWLYVALDEVCMEARDENYMLLWPRTAVGITYNITKPCVEGVLYSIN